MSDEVSLVALEAGLGDGGAMTVPGADVKSSSEPTRDLGEV